ncbi:MULTISPECIES: response regulator [Azorhizobium]|uniref:Response regulator receiver n=1 Tax=Azorhizobium caulinodans (strain ATCC 43989 / DSM 5975 / JCM 20966 / LMG 6465 / NBRC 14845 / NCIMB 13405 / ORS 571) TaxID=438753 RepID=A8IJU3_AZOC5|nr:MULTISPECIES: response regulator [Azorhizobium]TDT96624.1 response regulator receiver domain-containing protein [Azorhizobium sp. AG788]BAF86357.1 response regulator receiver [Azorhizobium caulinodans ORS 571]
MPQQQLIKQLPLLRRYARALLGSQEAGDRLVRDTLQAVVDGQVSIDPNVSPRVALYRALHQIWEPRSTPDVAVGSHADQRLQSLNASSRVALLLTAMEGFSYAEASAILRVGLEDVEQQVVAAQAEIDRQLATRVLIIEDEWVIALDLKTLVTDLGHEVVGVAPTHTKALELAKDGDFGLVLADIQLADGSSGIDAVTDILGSFDVPVIFITAFPDRLLTGERPEPTYLITKPFLSETVKATIAQALFFHQTKSDAAQERAQRIA